MLRQTIIAFCTSFAITYYSVYFECQKQELSVFVNDYVSDDDDDDDLKHSKKIISLVLSEKYLLKKIFIFHNPKL